MSDEWLIPNTVNMITLQDADGNFYYVSQFLYDQAVILYDRYSEDRISLRTMIGASYYDCCNTFFETAPEPINILGDFLGLIEGDLGEEPSMERMSGAISVMSMNINFRTMLTFPSNTRNQIRFPMRITNSYQKSYEMFYMDCLSYDDVMDRMRGAVPMPNGAQQEEDASDSFMSFFEDDGGSFEPPVIPTAESAPSLEEVREVPVLTDAGARPSSALEDWV